MLSTGGIIGIPIFETMSETMKRAMLWLNRNGDGRCPAYKALQDPGAGFSKHGGLFDQVTDHSAIWTDNMGGWPVTRSDSPSC